MISAAGRPGLKGQRQTLVCEHNVAGHVDKFSTPSMIGLMERASIEATLIGTSHNLLMLWRNSRAPGGWTQARWN